MKILKLICKLLLIPAVLPLMLLQWVLTFLCGFSSIVFNILSGIVFTVALLALVFGLATGTEALRIFLISFTLYILPVIGNTVAKWSICLRTTVTNFIKS